MPNKKNDDRKFRASLLRDRAELADKAANIHLKGAAKSKSKEARESDLRLARASRARANKARLEASRLMGSIRKPRTIEPRTIEPRPKPKKK